jgi:hypothetical protein
LRKIGKNILRFVFRIIGYSIELVLFLTIVLMFLVRSYWFQTELAKFIASYYSIALNTEITIERVKIQGFDSAEFINLYVADQKGDTLIWSPKLSTNLNMLSLPDNFAVLDDITAKTTRVKIQKYQGDTTFNFQFIADYFASEDTTSSKFKIKIKDIVLSDLHISFHDWNKEPTHDGIDYNHIDIRYLTGKIQSLRNKNGVTSMNIVGLTFLEHSGFELDNLTCYFLLNDKKMKLDGLKLQTNNSNIDSRGIQFNYHDLSDFSDFIYAVDMNADFNPTRLYMGDLAYFSPIFKDIDKNVKIEGNIHGRVNELYIDELYLGISPVTFFKGSGEIKGLPDVNEALFYLDIHQLQTSADDLSRLDFKKFGLGEDLVIPEQLNTLGVVHIGGILDGYLNDFKMDMAIKSELGRVDGFFDVKTSTEGQLNVDGELLTDNAHLGKIMGTNEIGNFSSDLHVSLQYKPEKTILLKKKKVISKSDLLVTLEGSITDVDLLQYRYREIVLNGTLHNDDFIGNVKVNDPNLTLNFDGEIDLNSSKSMFDFKTNVTSVNLYEILKSTNNEFLAKHKTAEIKGLVNVNGYGTSLNDFNGSIDLFDIHMIENNVDYFFDKVLISSYIPGKRRSITVESKFANIDMEGVFSFDSIADSFYALSYRMFPSIIPYKKGVDLHDQLFDLTIDVNDLSMLTTLFYPELSVSKNTEISCQYNSKKELLEFSASSDWLEYDQLRMVKLVIDTTQKFSIFDPFYTFDVSFDSVIYDQFHAENVTLETNLFNDYVQSKIKWANKDSLQYASLITDINVDNLSKFSISIHPSVFYDHRVGTWDILNDAYVDIELVPSAVDPLKTATLVKIDNLLAVNGNQNIRVYGTVSENSKDMMNLQLINFDLANVNPFVGTDKFKLDGELNLTGYVADVYNNLYFDAYNTVDSLQFNNRLVGNIETTALWNPTEDRIEVFGDIFRSENDSQFKIIKGHYYPKKEVDYLDFETAFLGTDLKFANAFMPEGISNLSGKIDGKLFLTGSFEEPLFESKNLFLRNVGLNVDMLNTSYFVTGRVDVYPDAIYADALPIKDKLGSKGLLNLSFVHQNFERYNYEVFSIFNEPFLVMNTTYRMNPLYYGNAFATGDFNIEYDYRDMLMKISVNAKTSKGTNVTLPLYGSEEVVLQEFITFVNTKVDSTKDYNVDLEGVSLNLSLDVTEDANIQLVFDEKVGDAMRGTGVGHIDMYIDQFYDFYMFGNYTVTEGSYLFTLKDVINKRFKVKKGSTIDWYGDPYEADLDLVAIYNLRTSLYDIMPENTREQYRQKLDVNTELHLTNSLFNPNLNFDITVPKADENAKTVLKNLISEETERNKQVFALLMLNKFLPGEYNTGGSSSGSGAVLGNTTSEMLSNQLSNMLSKFSDELEIGINYNPGSGMNSQEVALALSTQLFDDRLTIKTNLGVSNQRSQGSSNAIADVDIEYVLNDEGNVSVRAFNRSNEFDVTRQDVGGFTQGGGIFYKESFNSIGEFMCKLRNLFIPKMLECTDCTSECNEILDEETRKECERKRDNEMYGCRGNCEKITDDPTLKRNCQTENCNKILDEEKRRKCLESIK